MSHQLYFRPVTPPPPGTSLGGHPVKGLLLDAFGVGEYVVGTELFRLGPGDLPTLQALRRIEAARLERLVGGAGASATSLTLAAARECFEALTTLIDEIGKVGEIQLWLDE